ncbi:MAG TPA: 50S ribosomal protein L3 [Clostridiaceae bacterium]|jgi:large subunit ribosomal protein L3|nr:50S ribosomal protein L3 [Clostridiaceae bacterium]HOA30823.1 50S ribosomal protein L3 [Clostridia bacterium]
MKFILGKKVGMTQVFDEEGVIIPVTVVQAGPCAVVQKKTVETDGYDAVRVGYEKIEKRKLNKPDRGLFDKLDMDAYRYLKEFRTEKIDDFEVGQEISIDKMFADGDSVDVSGISKGKGFQGSIKRHGQSRGPMSHGSKYHRGVGSLGSTSDPGRVFKGRKLPGQMGRERVTVQNLKIVKVDAERGLLLIKGAVPGPRGGLLEIRESVKA